MSCEGFLLDFWQDQHGRNTRSSWPASGWRFGLDQQRGFCDTLRPEIPASRAIARSEGRSHCWSPSRITGTDDLMTTTRLFIWAIAMTLCCGMVTAAEPARLPAAKPPSLWNKLFGRTQGPPVARPLSRDRSLSAASDNKPSGVQRASFEEPARVAAPVARPAKAPAPLTSWFRRSRHPSRTVSEYMAEERP